MRVAVPVILKLFHVVAPAKVLLPAMVKVEPVAVTVPAVLVKVVTVQVSVPAKVNPPELFKISSVPETVPPVTVTADEPANVPVFTHVKSVVVIAPVL